MKKDNMNLIKQIELINEYILDECQENLYYLPNSNIRIFERIKNSSLALINNAMRILRNQTPLIKTSGVPLTIESTRDLMFKIYKIIITTEFPVIKEDKIKKLMSAEFSINPDDLLKQYPSFEQEYARSLAIINDTL